MHSLIANSVAAPPAFPILDAPIPQTPALQQRQSPNPPSPTTSATEIEPELSPGGHVGAALPSENNRQLVRQGAVVLDSAIDPQLLHPTPPAAASPVAGPQAPSGVPPATGTSAVAGRNGNANAGLLNDSDDDEAKEVVQRPKDWSDPYLTLAYIKFKRVKIADLTRRTNQFKKTFFKMRRDAMSLEIQTGAFVGLFVCKAHKNRDDDQHSYNFHFSDTIIHNVVLVELAKNLKKDVKAHMQAIWATGVGKGESALIVQQREQLAEANKLAGTLRAQAEVEQTRSKGQRKEIQRQEKAMEKQKLKLAAMRARMRAAGVFSEEEEEDSDMNDSDSSGDSGGE
ncbi:hypothetical protein P7C70_g7912, partial [Phenoliferia sp. Uapishka_3]